MRRPILSACGLAAFVVLVCAVEARASGPGGLLLQRRGSYRIPAPINVDSSPQIDGLVKALHALGATDKDYDGHRRKAVEHVAKAIRMLETPNNKGKSNAAIDQAEAGRPAVATDKAKTPDEASEQSLHKAKDALFVVHHKLVDKQATKAHITADAQVRLAIDEVVAALKPPAAPKGAKPGAGSSSATARK